MRSKILVLGCSMTLHHGVTEQPLPGIREKLGDYPYYLSQQFPEADWFNFGKGASSNFEYVRRISTFIDHFGRPDFILVQLTFAERMLLEFSNYKKINIQQDQLSSNYFILTEKNIREQAAYISGYNIYCSFLPEKTVKAIKDPLTLHLTSTFHAWRFWETHFFIQNYLKKIDVPHLIFLTHEPTQMPTPPTNHLPLDFSTTLEKGDSTLYRWLENTYGPYEDLTIGDGDWHLKMKYNQSVAQDFLSPHLKPLIK